jgi:hypothetical protein
MTWSNSDWRNDYDEDKALDAYISGNLTHLVGASEAIGYYFALKQERVKHNPAEAEFIQELIGVQPKEITNIVELGADLIFNRIKTRIRNGQIPINRCPQRNRIVRTPRARQCFWCGHDWHHV